MSAEKVKLTDAELSTLSAWLYHHRVSSFGLRRDIAAAVERIVAERMAEAWDQGARSQWQMGDALADDSFNNPYRLLDLPTREES